VKEKSWKTKADLDIELNIENKTIAVSMAFFFTTDQQPSGPRPPHYRGFLITLRQTTLSRTPLDE
jgi:hypothetical protein